jgi:hypothetical protein
VCLLPVIWIIFIAFELAKIVVGPLVR